MTNLNSIQVQQIEANSLELLCELVAADYGITLVPSFHVLSKQQDTRLKFIPLQSGHNSRQIAIFFRPTSAKKACIDAIAKHIMSICQPLLKS